MKRGLWTMAMGLIGCACVAAETPRVTLQPGDRLHGFVVQAVEDLPEIHACLVRMAYEKNGADLVWLARAEENKTFGIAFRTPPENDRGVAHILEHSVLCGSGRYPVKEPFVELLKSSMATFLNAVTWPDLTVYPVSTRNGRDLSNLVGVYLDAVFDPRCVREPWVLDQEGWHYEVAEDGSLSRTGVVHSEMKGSFASPDTVAFHGLKRLLFPDTCYGKVSGGDPVHIPELTFDEFTSFYRKHYHPSNARIFLDGDLDLPSILAQLDGYLSRYDRAPVTSQLPRQAPVARQQTLTYESAEEEGRVILRDGWAFSSVADRETQLLLDILADYFTATNESPLKKALLEAGLCEDVGFGSSTFSQIMASVTVRNTTLEKAAACRALVRKTFETACREGLDQERLAAIIDKQEFSLLEFDTGTYPKGIALMNMAMEPWKHDLDPASAFRFRELFAGIRAKMKDRLFETCLEKFFLTNPHHAELTLVPSRTLAAERAAAEAKACAAHKASLSDEAFARLAAASAALKAHQSEADRPEDLAKLPRLTVKDVPLEGRETPFTEETVDGVPVIRPEVDVEGLFYVALNFRVDDLSDDDLRDLSLLTQLIGHLDTTHHTAAELQTVQDRTFGDFSLETSSYLRGSWLTVRVAALNRRQAEAGRLVTELLLGTRYDDAEAIAAIRTQMRAALERGASRSGDSLAIMRSVRGFSEVSRQAELFDGLSQLRRLQEPACTVDFAALARKVFVRNRLTVMATAGAEGAFVKDLIGAFPEAGARATPGRGTTSVGKSVASEGLEIPGNIAFSAFSSHLPDGVDLRGEHFVAARIVSLDYLWNAVRVKGGAYGAGLFISASGNVVFRSYRDPNPAGARDSFRKAGEALRAFVASGKSFENYQVASIGKREPYRSPKAEAEEVLSERLFAGRSAADRARLRREILTATPEKLLAVAAELEAAVKTGVSCVVAGGKILATCGLERIEPVAASAPGLK